MLTVKELLDAEKLYKTTQTALQTIARQIAAMRQGGSIHDEFKLHHYSIGDAEKYQQNSDDDVDYPTGTQVAHVNLFHHRWAHELNVTFPVDYLDGTHDYLTREAKAVAERKESAERDAVKQARIDEQEAVNQRRATYEQLRQEFE